MKIATDRQGDVLQIEVTGRLDPNDAVGFVETLQATFGVDDRAVLIDFEKLDYISSAGVRSIMMTAKNLKKQEKEFALCALPGTIYRVFILSGMDKIIAIYPSKAEALASLEA